MARAIMVVEDRVRFGDLDAPKSIARSKTQVVGSEVVAEGINVGVSV
jgi:hypothetical protein